jgi:hypothetical protein
MYFAIRYPQEGFGARVFFYKARALAKNFGVSWRQNLAKIVYINSANVNPPTI